MSKCERGKSVYITTEFIIAKRILTKYNKIGTQVSSVFRSMSNIDDNNIHYSYVIACYIIINKYNYNMK